MTQVNGEVKQTWHFRISEADIERIRVLSKRMGKKVGTTVTLAAVLRRCVSLGLAQLERGK